MFDRYRCGEEWGEDVGYVSFNCCCVDLKYVYQCTYFYLLYSCIRYIKNRGIVAGDGRYHNPQAIQSITQLLAANGISNIWIPQSGIMSTPAVSAVIRRRTASGSGKDGEGVAQGGIVLTASHNPGERVKCS